MRRLLHLPLSPASRFVRLVIGEKRMTLDLATAEDAEAHLPILVELDGSRKVGLWAIIDHLEGTYPEPALTPEDANERADSLSWLDWVMNQFHEQVTARIVFEKAPQRFTGAMSRRAPDMNVIRQGRESLKGALARIGGAAEVNGNLTARTCSLGDLAVAAHISTLDYFGEVPWREYPTAAEWYMRMKSRPSFRSVLADRVPGQPPVAHYGELDF
jgi:glutathione S-transferase